MGRKRREKGVGKDVVKLEPCTLTVGLYNGASQRTKILWFDLHEVLRAVKFKEKQSGPVVARGWEQGKWAVSALTAH